MPCCIAFFALSAPRVAIVLVVLFSDYIGTAYQTTLVPLVGFFVAPLTTLAYAWAIHSNGSVEGVHFAVVVVAVLVDFGVIGGSARRAGRSGERADS
jgi:hypothetical protein